MIDRFILLTQVKILYYFKINLKTNVLFVISYLHNLTLRELLLLKLLLRENIIT